MYICMYKYIHKLTNTVLIDELTKKIVWGYNTVNVFLYGRPNFC